MTFLERLLSKKIITAKKVFTNVRPSLLFLQPKSNKYTGKEYYPHSCRLDIFQYKDIFICKLYTTINVYNLETKYYTVVKDVVEVSIPYSSKCRQVIANKLLQLASKKLMKKYKPLGYKESLIDYLYITENEPEKYNLELETTYEKFNKFRSIRYGG